MQGRKISIVDTTLRDGEETAGVVLLPKVRSHVVDLKRSLFDKELVYVYRDYFGSRH